MQVRTPPNALVMFTAQGADAKPDFRHCLLVPADSADSKSWQTAWHLLYMVMD